MRLRSGIFFVTIVLLTIQGQAAQRKRVVLRDGWCVKQLETNRPGIDDLTRTLGNPDEGWMNAVMPAQVHDVLLAHDRIADPRVGRNAAACAWVGEKDWAYACRFATPEGITGPAFMRFKGLDTLADAYLNGAAIGHFQNMFREYPVEVADHLAPAGGQNTLLIIFSSPLRFARAAKLPADDSGAAKHKSLRKTHCDFGSYIGARPHSVKVGVYRDVVLDVPDHAWIEDVCVRPYLSSDLGSANVHVRVETAGDEASLRWILIGPSGREVDCGHHVTSGEANFEIPVLDPQLWWPRMQGPQNLYTLDVNLHGGGRVLDERRTVFGIREVKPVLSDPDTGEKRFRFDINGRPVFLRGGNWVPVEGATHVWQPQRALQLLDLAEHANMNILRIWGEGELPPPSFYEECDRRGLCLWQDFMFGYYDHREGDTEFLDNCRKEVEQTIRRLRNHPSVLLWSGGNEQYLWSSTTEVPPSKREVFEKLLPNACRRLDPTRLFHTSSPYGGPTGNWPLKGDWHDYTTINFAPEASVPLFGSEVLRASVPSARGMRRFLSEEEFWPQGFSPAVRNPGQPAWPPAWAYHSTGIGTWDRIGAIQEYCDPASAEDLIRVLGMAHGEYLRDRVERERRGTPDGTPDDNRRCWGNIVWRLNDAWPMIYSSVVDYYLEPKIAYYFLRRAYEPVLVSFEKTRDRISVWVVNDSPQAVAGTLAVQRLGFDGKVSGRIEAEVSIAPGQSRRCLTTTELGEINLRTQFLQATFAGREASLLLIGERYLHLPSANLRASITGDTITITSDLFVRSVSLEMTDTVGTVFEDNFLDLSPGQTRTVRVIHPSGGCKVTVTALNAKPIELTRTP